MILTFLFSATQTSDGIAGHFVFAGDHLIEALISQFCIETSLHDGKQILDIIFARALVEFNASVQPSYGPPHGFFHSRTDSETGH